MPSLHPYYSIVENVYCCNSSFMFNLSQSVRSFVCFCMALKVAFDQMAQWCNCQHGRSGSVHVPRSQPSLLHSTLLSLGLPGATRTCKEVYCYYLVWGSCSGYRYVGIFVSLFGYYSCQHSGLLIALSLSQSRLLCRKLACLGTALLAKDRHDHAILLTWCRYIYMYMCM